MSNRSELNSYIPGDILVPVENSDWPSRAPIMYLSYIVDTSYEDCFEFFDPEDLCIYSETAAYSRENFVNISACSRASRNDAVETDKMIEKIKAQLQKNLAMRKDVSSCCW